MRLKLLLLALCSTAVVGSLYYLVSDPAKLVEYYARNIRGSLFTGFLTVGGFLFSLMTFIIVKMKENVYDHEAYQKRVANQKNLNAKLTFYGPLQRLSHLLFVSVLASITCSALQLTVGLLEHWLAVLVCLWFCIFALLLLVTSLLMIKKNLDQWFEFLEEAKKT